MNRCLCNRHADLDRHGRGTWLSPDISPDGGTLVFELLGDLFTVDTRGGSAHALTTGMAFDSQPVFSPTVMTSPSSVTGPAPRTSGSSGRRLESPATDDTRRQFGLCLARMERGRQVDLRVALPLRIQWLRVVAGRRGERCYETPDPGEEGFRHAARASFERAGCIPVGRRQIPLLRAPHR